MAKVSLKRIVKRKEVNRLLDDILNLSGASFIVKDHSGKVLFGDNGDNGPAHPITLDAESIGNVFGGAIAKTVATMLTQMAVLERDKKVVAQETLEKYRELSLLYEVTEQISKSLDPEEIGQLVLEGALRLIEADRVSVMLLDENRGVLSILAAIGEELTPGTEIPADWGIPGSVLANGKAEIVNDAPNDPRFVQGALTIKSLMCAPMRVNDVDIGLLWVSSETSRSYRADDLKLLSGLSSQSAAAIENARLFKDLEKKVADRTKDLREANDRLKEEIKERIQAQNHLQEELDKAAGYVKSILPEPLSEGSIRTTWRFVPCVSLGGDSFGYHWLNDDQFVMYLLDVSGHGVGAALLSVSVMNLLRGQTLPGTDFSQPDQVLFALNNAFPMEQQNGMYFTMWYGVYQKSTRTLVFASGGHPPALILEGPPDRPGTPVELKTPKMFIGGLPGLKFVNETYQMSEQSRLYIFCDGVYEITLPNGDLWDFGEFLTFMSQPSTPDNSILDPLFNKCKELSELEILDDDFSIMEIHFD